MFADDVTTWDDCAISLTHLRLLLQLGYHPSSSTWFLENVRKPSNDTALIKINKTKLKPPKNVNVIE